MNPIDDPQTLTAINLTRAILSSDNPSQIVKDLDEHDPDCEVIINDLMDVKRATSEYQSIKEKMTAYAIVLSDMKKRCKLLENALELYMTNADLGQLTNEDAIVKLETTRKMPPPNEKIMRSIMAQSDINEELIDRCYKNLKLFRTQNQNVTTKLKIQTDYLKEVEHMKKEQLKKKQKRERADDAEEDND